MAFILEQRPSPISLGTLPSQPHLSLNIVLVDPDPLRRSEMKTLLLSQDFVRRVGVRHTRHYLLDTITEYTVDAILFDETLGWENILDAVREIRYHPTAENIGFVVIAEAFNDQVRRQGSQVGILGYLQKPFTPGQLRSAVRESLGIVGEQGGREMRSMRAVSFFAGFSDRDLLRLMNICSTLRIKPGEYLFREKDRGDTMYILLEGEIAISLTTGESTKRLATLKPGESLGEMAILDDSPRSADAMATRPTTVFEINRFALHEDNSLLALRMTRQIAMMLAEKIRHFNYSLRETK